MWFCIRHYPGGVFSKREREKSINNSSANLKNLFPPPGIWSRVRRAPDESKKKKKDKKNKEPKDPNTTKKPKTDKKGKKKEKQKTTLPPTTTSENRQRSRLHMNHVHEFC